MCYNLQSIVTWNVNMMIYLSKFSNVYIAVGLAFEVSLNLSILFSWVYALFTCIGLTKQY
jgi:hypothetical protein